MMKRRLLYVAIVALFMFVLAACGGVDNDHVNNDHVNNHTNANVNDLNDQDNANNDEDDDEAGGDDSTSLETEYPLVVTDATGEEITFEAAPERIVSTSPAETEILFALGLDDYIVGVSDYDTYPEEVYTKEKVGGVVAPNVEALIALESDLIVTGISISEEAAEEIGNFDMKLYRTDPKTVQDVMDNILLLGEITNRQVAAQALIEQMQDDIEYVTSTVASLEEAEQKRVYLEFAPGFTVGQGEFLHELLEMAGGINIAADTVSWSQINEEKIIESNPEVILYGAAIEVDGSPLHEVIQQRSGWDAMTAVQEDRIYALDDDILTRPGPRIIEGLKLMAEAIYPELFEE